MCVIIKKIASTAKAAKSEEEALVKMAAPTAEVLPPKPIKGEVQINFPLYLYYVKNGDPTEADYKPYYTIVNPTNVEGMRKVKNISIQLAF